MTWLTPVLGGIAAGIAIPALIILYFLKLRRRDLEISTTLLWKRAIEDLQANAPFQKLRRNLLLLLQLLVLAAALLAIAQPQIQGTQVSGGKHVILIDNSASSQTLDETDDAGRPITRLERAKLEAIALVESLQEPGFFSKRADEAMVLAFNTEPNILQHFSSDKRALKAAIESIRSTDRPSRLVPAVKLIGEYAPRDLFTEEQPDGQFATYERPRKRIGTIHIYTDGQLPDAADAQFGPLDDVVYEALGDDATENVGITSLRAGRDFNDPTQLAICVGLSSNAPRQTTFDLELIIDGSVTEIKTVTMPPAEPGPVDPDAPGPPRLRPSTGGVIFELDQPRGVVAAVRVRAADGSPPDSFSVDDRAWLVIPPAKQLAVAVVTTGNLFIADAIAGFPFSRLDTLSPSQYERVIDEGKVGDYDVVILDGYLPDAGDDAPIGLPPGRFLIFNAVPQSHETMIDAGTLDEIGVIIDWKHNHPALRGLSLSSLYIFKSRAVTLPEDSTATVLAYAAVETQNIPAILEVATAETRAIVVPFDVAQSSWGFDLSWVVFLLSTVQYLGEAGSTGIGQSIQPGRQITDRIPAGAQEVSVRTPDDRTVAIVPADDGSIIFGPIYDTGIYTVSWKGAARADDVQSGSRVSRAYAANLIDPAESNVATAHLRTAQGDHAAQSAADEDIQSPKRLWPWLILAALVISLFEWYIYNRKVYV